MNIERKWIKVNLITKLDIRLTEYLIMNDVENDDDE